MIKVSMRELSSGPEAHLFRTPGSSLAERIHPVRCSTRAFSPSGARGESEINLLEGYFEDV